VTDPAPRYEVVVTVGTDHHPFPRLVGWIHRWASEHPDLHVLLQLGTTTPPAPLPSVHAVALLPHRELVDAMAGADVVVAQGGPGGIMDARSVGRQPVAVPRRGDLGEHVDDHQVRFTAWMADRGLVRLADDEGALFAELDAGLADPSRLRIPPDGGAIDDTITAFRAVVDPLLATRRSRRTR
jgi:UDP-N-acetylglucosamine transferase subunit ALG13